MRNERTGPSTKNGVICLWPCQDTEGASSFSLQESWIPRGQSAVVFRRVPCGLMGESAKETFQNALQKFSYVNQHLLSLSLSITVAGHIVQKQVD
eukprot:675548-Amphidinium_carterae.1